MCVQKIILVSIFLFSSFAFTILSEWQTINSGEASKELLEINKKFVQIKSYSFDVSYKTYRDHSTNEVFEQNEGKVIRDGINYRSEIMGKLIVQNKDLRVTIDTASKLMKVNNAFEGVDVELSPEASVKVLEVCKTVKKAKERDVTGFRFEMKASRGIVAQEVYFDTDFMKRFVYYYVNQNDLRVNSEIREEVVYPKLIVDFTQFKKLEKVNKEFFNTSSLVTIKKGKLVPLGIYKNYKLIDGRYYK